MRLTDNYFIMASYIKTKKSSGIKPVSQKTAQFRIDGYDGIYLSEELQILK